MSDGEVEARFHALEAEEAVDSQAKPALPGDGVPGASPSDAPAAKNAEEGATPKVRVRIEP
jgi:hypothetical protein